MPDALLQRLQQGLADLQLNLTLHQQQLLLQYVSMMMKWNKAYNLSAIRDPLEAIDKHIIDSLTLLPMLGNEQDYLDIGAGAGLPGIPLAIVKPDINITLVDSNGKKTRFIQQAIASLGLNNTRVMQSRIEQLPLDIKFDIVMARALATLEQMLIWLGPRLQADRKLLAMKGVFPEEELSQVPKGYTVSAVTALAVPGNAVSRHAVIVQAVA